MKEINWSERINLMATLEKGWDSYGAETPLAETREAAKRFLARCVEAEVEPSRVNPSVVGGVGFTFRREGTRSVYVEFRNTGSCHAAFIRGDGSSVEVVKVNPSGFDDLLRRIGEYLRG